MDFSHADHHVGTSPGDAEYAATPPGAGYEHTDANVWIIAKFGLWLVISAVIIHVGLGFLFAFFVKQREEVTPQFPLASEEHRLPAAPRLQQFPVNEYYDFRQHEEAVLHKYGWVNKDAGVVRMPIEEAMRKMVEGTAAPAPTTGVPTLGLMPQDSSSGRTMERRRQ